MSRTCEWSWVSARTPSGKTRMIQQCRACKRVKYRHHGEILYVWPDGRAHSARTTDESWCDGAAS